MCLHFGADLPTKVPVIWNSIESLKTRANDDTIGQLYAGNINADQANELITVLQLIETATPHLHVSLHVNLFAMLPHMSSLLKHPLKAVRFFKFKSFWGLSKDCPFLQFRFVT